MTSETSSGPYSSDVLRLAADIPRIGRLADPDASAHRVARLCGSTLDLDLKVEDGVVTDLGLEVQACALGQAAASVLACEGVGAGVGEVYEARDALKAMLKQDGPAPQGRFSALAALQPARDYPARHGSILLAFEAACEALDRLDAR
ncbi:iron-sulfur cluster assembly scaffold protein [Marinicauda pacifica]|uniref:Iron-sulfur cluster assembly scaffold protein n=1 Tax=Marinicauda pacifica TaxID=1133559 RepID=A0A4S2HBF8_9PROT|nr:iron-sulfur cluster assembly scaffold protein [Marinicauda pacifica]TGY93008.1 iron-sulfur cluster assembly scaffold protein [Marinicauda pacifica]GGE42097.1 iron-sulfur cluster assembly scaffold protein [Marinicauda pacifica]